MAIPDFQSIMLPLLKSLGDNEEKLNDQLRENIITHFKISELEQNERIPSGKQSLYKNRIAWAIAYLKMANLIKATGRAKYQITEQGNQLLKNNPEKINIALLKKYPEFNKNRNPEKLDTIDEIEIKNETIDEQTPDELIEIGYKKIRSQLFGQILSTIMSSPPDFFEKLVLDLLLKMGYGGSDIDSSQLTGPGSDEGIDGIIKEDKLGLDKIYIQAKRWENNVGRPEIQKFVGALQGKRAKKGIFITTSNFTREAMEYASNVDNSIVLIDGIELAKHMIDHELGVTVKSVYKICSLDSDYFTDY
jgi:restriction system protein